jgi:hypothetical protein
VATGVNTVAKHFLDWLANPDVGPGNTLQQFLKNVGDIITSLSPGVTRFADAILKLANDASPFFDTVAGIFDQISTDLDNWVSGDGVSTIGADFKVLGDTLKGVVPLVEQVGKMLVKSLADPNTKQAIQDTLKTVSDLLKGIGPSLPVMVKAFDQWVKAIDAVMPAITGMIEALSGISLALAYLTKAGEFFVIMFQQAWQWLYDELVGHSIIPDLVNGITGWLSKLGAIPGWFLGWFKKAASAVSSATGSIISTVRGLPGRISSALGNLGGLLYDRGRQIVQGLVNGIQSAADWLIQVASHLAAEVSGAFASVLGIASPSKVFIEHGMNIVAGLVAGMQGESGYATRAAAGLAGMTAAGFGTPTLAATAASIGSATGAGGGPPGAGGDTVVNLTAHLDGQVVYQRLVTIAQRHKGRNVTTQFA